MTDLPKFSMVYALTLELATTLGAKNIKELPGCWEYQIDDAWRVSINGHGEGRTDSLNHTVPPYCCCFTFNEWPAGIVSPSDGVIAAGSLANEDTLCAALEAAIARAKCPH